MADDVKRGRTPLERDVYRAKHPPKQAVPEYACDDLTDRYEGAELARMRARRPTDKRLARLEEKDDKHERDITEIKDDVAEIKVSIAEWRGDQKAANASLASIEKSVERILEREEDIAKFQRADSLDIRKTKRERVTKVIAAVLGGGFLMELLHRLGVW